MSGVELVPADVDAKAAEVERQVAEARAQAESVEVHDEASATLATELLRQIQRRRKAAEKEREEIVKPIKDHANLLHRRLKDAMAPFEEADAIIRGKVQAYTTEQERIRQAEEVRLAQEREEREQKIRQERERQEAAAKAQREQKEKEAREAEEEAKRAEDEEDRKAAEALAEEARVKAQEAATAESAIASLPEVELPQAVVPAAAKPEGLITSKHWEFEVTDLAAVPDQLPDGTPLKQLLTSALRTYMHAYIKEHGKPPEMAGIEFKQVARQAVRA